MAILQNEPVYAPSHVDVIAQYGAGDAHINESELDWIPYVIPQAFWKPLRFDVSRGIVHALLWIKEPGVLGRHQHHGPVTGFVLEGSWYYKEYDWVATPGSMVSEAPGAVHTLITDNPKGMKSLFIVEGNMDFFGDDGTYVGTNNVFWNIEEYLKHCAKHSLPVNEALFRS